MPDLPPIGVRVDFKGGGLAEGKAELEAFADTAEKKIEPARRSLRGLGDDADGSGKKVTRALKDIGDESDKTKFQFLDLGRAGVQPANAIIAVGVAAAIAAAPLIAYTAGLAGALAIGALVVGGMAALGAGVIALAANFNGWAGSSDRVQQAQQKLAAAQKAVNDALVPTRLQLIHLREAHEELARAQAEGQNPLARFTGAISNMGDALGKQATPAAAQLLGWLTTLVPSIQALGSEIVAWFGDRVPAAITIGNRIFGDFLGAIRDLGARLGPIFDEILKNPETIERAFQKAFGGTVDAIVWLVTNLLKLSKWWDDNGPRFEAVARGTLTVVANLIIWLAQQVENLANLFNFLEPIAAGLWGGIMEGINNVMPVIQFMVSAFQSLGPVLDFIKLHADSLRPVLIILGMSFGMTAAFIILLAGTIVGLIAGVVALVSAISWLVSWIRDRIPDAIRGVGGWFSALGGWFNGLVGLAQRSVKALQDLAYVITHMPSVQGIGSAISNFHFAKGGIASPGKMFISGEQGPEVGYALPGGGVLISPMQGGGDTGGNASGANVTIQILGAGLNEEQVALAIERRLSRVFQG